MTFSRLKPLVADGQKLRSFGNVSHLAMANGNRGTTTPSPP